MSLDKEPSWILLGLEAIRLAFDQNEQIDLIRSSEDINQAKKLFYKCLDQKPDAAWVYIKLADLVSEKAEKIRLYKESLVVEETDFAKARLYDLTK